MTSTAGFLVAEDTDHDQPCSDHSSIGEASKGRRVSGISQVLRGYQRAGLILAGAAKEVSGLGMSCLCMHVHVIILTVRLMFSFMWGAAHSRQGDAHVTF